MPLQICVLGGSHERAQAILAEFARENSHQVWLRNPNWVEMEDGTCLFAYSVDDVKDRFDGTRFDQLFVDASIHPRTILTCRPQIMASLARSCVPERFKFQPVYQRKGGVHNVRR